MPSVRIEGAAKGEAKSGASISGLESNYIRIRFVVESFSPEPNENGLFDGTIWSGFESIETAIVQLLKVRTEIKRETLEA
jgi:hypothetical protein